MLKKVQFPNADIPTHMPFGKHKGKVFAEVPSNYLEWLQDQEWVHASLQEAIEQEYHRRDRDDCHWKE